jgi:hypothetical protein
MLLMNEPLANPSAPSQITRKRLRIALAGYAGDAGRSGGSSACAASYS